MPTFKFTSPEGKTYSVNGPEGATQEQAFDMLQSHLSASKPAEVPPTPQKDQTLWEKARPFVAPALEGTMGALGGIVGSAAGAVASPTIVANPITGGIAGSSLGYAGAKQLEKIGDVMWGGQEAPRGLSAITEPVGNLVEGAALDVTGRGIGGIAKGAVGLKNVIANKLLSKPPLGEVKQATLLKGQSLGLAVPPSVTKPTIGNALAEGAAGKDLTERIAANNQEVTDAVARKALRLADNKPLTKDTLQEVRNAEFKKGYKPIKNIGSVPTGKEYLGDLENIAKSYRGSSASFPKAVSDQVKTLVNSFKVKKFDSSDALDMIKSLRSEAKGNFDSGNVNMAKAQMEISGALENQIERHLASSDSKGAAQLLNQFRDSRKQIAIAHAVDDALHVGSGHVDGTALASDIQKGKYLTDDLKTIAEFHNTFRDAVKSPGSVSESVAMDLPTTGRKIANTLVSSKMKNQLLSEAVNANKPKIPNIDYGEKNDFPTGFMNALLVKQMSNLNRKEK